MSRNNGEIQPNYSRRPTICVSLDEESDNKLSTGLYYLMNSDDCVPDDRNVLQLFVSKKEDSKQFYLDQEPHKYYYIHPSVKRLLEKKSVGNKERTWHSNLQYILSTISVTIGLSNLWRFPWMCHKHGGGNFLFVYIFMAIFVAIPLAFMETGFGQCLRKGSLQIWRSVSPILGGLGLCTLCTAFMQFIYYNVVVSWCFTYFTKAFSYPLEWTTCPANASNCEVIGMPTYYWYNNVLVVPSDHDSFFNFSLKRVIMTVIPWFLVSFLVVKGIKGHWRISYFLAISPHLVLLIYFCRALVLPGSFSGIKYLFTPDFNNILYADIWIDAATQLLFSLFLGIGEYIPAAVHLPMKNNCLIDAYFLTIINCFNSLAAGITIFALIGVKSAVLSEQCLAVNASNTTCEIDHIIETSFSGYGITFITITEATSLFGSLSPLLSIMFFTIITLLGMSSMFNVFQCILLAVFDFKSLATFSKDSIAVTVTLLCAVCATMFTLSNTERTFQAFDEFAIVLPLALVTLKEVVVLMYIYGWKKLLKNFNFKPTVFNKIVMKYLTPVILTGCIVAKLVLSQISETKRDVHYSLTIYIIYFLVYITFILIHPAFLLVKTIKKKVLESKSQKSENNSIAIASL